MEKKKVDEMQTAGRKNGKISEKCTKQKKGTGISGQIITYVFMIFHQENLEITTLLRRMRNP